MPIGLAQPACFVHFEPRLLPCERTQLAIDLAMTLAVGRRLAVGMLLALATAARTVRLPCGIAVDLTPARVDIYLSISQHFTIPFRAAP